MRTTTRLLLASGVLLVLGAPSWADPLRKNLELLRARATGSKPKATAPAPSRPARPSGGANRTRRRVFRAARPSRPSPLPAAERFVSYSEERFGSKLRAGDLVVKTSKAEGATHVYVGQRLLSNEGNGQARVPDLAPGKHPVMVWAPEARKRRTYWVTIRSGKVAELQASL